MAFIRVFIFVSASLIGRWLDNYVCEGGCGDDLRVSGAFKVNRPGGYILVLSLHSPKRILIPTSPNHPQPVQKNRLGMFSF